jgi:hypothetical protein
VLMGLELVKSSPPLPPPLIEPERSPPAALLVAQCQVILV